MILGIVNIMGAIAMAPYTSVGTSMGKCNSNIRITPIMKSLQRSQRQSCIRTRCDVGRREVLSWGLSLISHHTVYKQLDKKEQHTFLSPIEGGEDVVVYVLDSGFNDGLDTFKHRVRMEDVTDAEMGRRWFDNFGHEHGTYVAGIIAGEKYGVAPNAEVVAVKIFNGEGASMLNIYEALKFVKRDIRKHRKHAVINMSIGMNLCPGVHAQGESIVQGIMADLINDGVVIVKAAGNEHSDAINDPLNRVPGLIVVGAINEDNEIDIYSNNGETVNLFAPGRIRKFRKTLWKYEETNEEIMGTSFAAPYVAGVAALYKSAGIKNVQDALFESATVNQVQTNLKYTKEYGLRGAFNRIVSTIPKDYVK